ncbi:hypothetical protein QBC44DRAFT_216376, partial [Cladorrhinum sp. PSN332]
MTDVLSLINDSITLIGTIYDFAEKYRGAQDSKASAGLFQSQLNNVRLDLVVTVLESDLDLKYLPEIQTAAEDLRTQLKQAKKELEKKNVDNGVGKLLWVIWGGSSILKLFQDVHDRIDILQGIAVIAKLTRDPHELNADQNNNFTINTSESSQTVLLVTVTMIVYSDQASWNKMPNATELRVLVDSFGYHPRDNDKARKRATKEAEKAARRLWWTGAPGDGQPQNFQTGVLSCIGFDKNNLVFLLPENAKLDVSLRHKIRTTASGVALDVQFSYALQLAQAVLKVHSAGLMHCAIRSNTILVV